VHYVQLMMHSSIYAYWGWYWDEVYRHIPLIIAQIVFAYALDMIVCWWRRDKWILGFGPFPIVLSTNLFLWFRDEWFFLQFLLIAIGVLAKEFIRWKREGRSAHIFNPSAFPLFLFSVILIATKTTGMTWGVEIASTFHRPPYIYQEIFVLGLIVQALFEVTLVTLSSAAVLCLLGVLYTKTTGDYQFIDSNIPVAVFLGLHLLVTDPATSPRRSLGKIIFGGLYGAGVFYVFDLLNAINAPSFYDKLLIVPPLNLCVRLLDRWSDAVTARFRWEGFLANLRPRQANYAWMGVWVGLFATMVGTHFLVKGKDHPGGHPEHWARSCEQGHSKACAIWVEVLDPSCADGNAADCLTVATLLDEGKYVPRSPMPAGNAYGRACDLGSRPGCDGLVAFERKEGPGVFLSSCDKGDAASCLILGSLYLQGQGVPRDSAAAFDLFQKSCANGMARGCGILGNSYLAGIGTSVNPQMAIVNFDKGCEGGNAGSCLEAARFYREGKQGQKIESLARQRFQQACKLGVEAACHEIALSEPATN
jgi:hypothetical protein